MAIKKYVAISYCFAFLFVYFISMAYALLSESANKLYNATLPQTQMMNSTVSAISSFTPNVGMLGIIGIIILIIAVICFIISSRSMAAAI